MKTPQTLQSWSQRTYPTRTIYKDYQEPSIKDKIENIKAHICYLYWSYLSAEEGAKRLFVIEPKIKNNRLPTWLHAIKVEGPPINDNDNYSELSILWFSEFEPETSRVLQAIDWNSHAISMTQEK